MKTTHTIKVKTLTKDNGDGGFTAYAYNNEEELLEDQYVMEDLEPGSDEWNKKAKEILDGENEYKNGYVGNYSFQVEIRSRMTAPLVLSVI